MLEIYTESLANYKRLMTREVRVGDLLIGNGHPIRIQTMTTTDTMDTAATVAQTIRCIEAGAELVRITAPSKKEAENLRAIKDELRSKGYNTPLVADIHYTPNAAEIAARIVEKVRVNPGNYIDKKKFDFIEYTDEQYAAEVDRIRERFTPLVRICKEHGTAMRIGTNHGSLSDRIMSRYGDTPMGMVESAMEFLRIARGEDYHQIILSMKSSNPQVMVHAYRLLVRQMDEEFGECYPLHLGVTEAGDGEDGRVKSAIGIGTLLEDGIGDTIRVSLTEEPELEIPVCKDIVHKYPPSDRLKGADENSFRPTRSLPYDPFSYKRRETIPIGNVGGSNVPVVVAWHLDKDGQIAREDLRPHGYTYNAATDKWHISDGAADYIYTGDSVPEFALPGTLQVLCEYECWQKLNDKSKCHPIYKIHEYMNNLVSIGPMHFLSVSITYENEDFEPLLDLLEKDQSLILVLSAGCKNSMKPMRRFIAMLMERGIKCPVIVNEESLSKSTEGQLIDYAISCGGLLLDGMTDGIMVHSANRSNDDIVVENSSSNGNSLGKFQNDVAFSILQATRTRISKTEYISCPSCGRTLFDLQDTTAKIRAATNHLKGVKIAIMGCIVNGPGEMADADFGYVGSGPGKITLYKNKEVVKRNVPDATAVEELINLLKDNGAWIDRTDN